MARQNEQQPKREKQESEYQEKVLHINRCSKVVKGGRKFSFSALILVADGKGRVGYGFGKANELTDAIRKGGEDARKNLVTIPTDGISIPHEVFVRHDGAAIYMRPAQKDSGVIAGTIARAIFEMAHIKNVMVKSLGGNNPINQVKALFAAIAQLKPKNVIEEMRGAAC